MKNKQNETQLNKLLAAYFEAEREAKEASEAVSKATIARRICEEEMATCRKKIQELMISSKLSNFVGNTGEVSFSNAKKMVYEDAVIIEYAQKNDLFDVLDIKIKRSIVRECLELGIDIPGVTVEDAESLVISTLKKETNWEELKK